MRTEELHPEKSFELITDVIAQARRKFEENGLVYVFWGVLMALASFGQYILLRNEFYKENWYPYLLMPVGAIISFFYFRKKTSSGAINLIGRIIGFAWIILSLNMMILGFAFAALLAENLVPVILVLLSVGIVISGVAIRSKLLIFSGVIINIAAFVGLNLAWMYHSLLSGIVAVVAVLIPGIVLMVQYRKRKHV